MDVDIRVAFQYRFQSTRQITGFNALAGRIVRGITAGANNISWTERTRNGSGRSGWTSWLAVTAAQEDHYGTRHMLGSEMKVRKDQRRLEIGEVKREVESAVGVLCGCEITGSWGVDGWYFVIATQSGAQG